MTLTAANKDESTKTSSEASDLEVLFRNQRTAFQKSPSPDMATRKKSLDKLLAILTEREEELIEAMAEDFGHRSHHESGMLDIGLPIGDVKDIKRHLRRWMKPRRSPPRIHLLPGTGKIIPQPLGVVGVIAPWNFPVYLTLSGVAAALAAGNRVMVKPSEVTPRTSQVMADAIAEKFDPSEVCFVTGDADVGKEFATLPFDHIIFTGSTAVGRKIAVSAAQNLTPVTLELGGKSPAIVGENEPVARAATKIVYGKMVNAGQICVAPDYVLVPESKLQDFKAAASDVATKFYPSIKDNPDYTCIVSDRHFARLNSLIEDAENKGATITQVGENGEASNSNNRKIPLTFVEGATDDMTVMQEEIFGPILPLIPYKSLDEALNFVNERDRPLALYAFTGSKVERDRILSGTISGGVTVNDTLWHVAYDSLPFGGVGASGMGAYHGKAGFDTFSHLKPVMYQPRLNAIFLFHPPYGRVIELVGKVLRKVM